MKKLNKLFVLLILIPFYGQCEFVEIGNYTLWSNTYNTETIRVFTPGQAVINPGDACSNTDSYMVSSKLDLNSKNRIYSTLLASLMAKKLVTLWISGCERERPAILHIVIN